MKKPNRIIAFLCAALVMLNALLSAYAQGEGANGGGGISTLGISGPPIIVLSNANIEIDEDEQDIVTVTVTDLFYASAELLIDVSCESGAD